ncbi:MAG: HD-GYP domain-containing protein [Undibacterium sp.]|uniref:HD-GYP domain-containing protein n=1 Tax=Undibacterium sp. TaxID=1914977 RepID=UPI0027170CC2|nr:HD-GYP domain-containing protein [Undibacterium sp.]MDO8654228.1 HD-GYP domain-containing protein [Undibacterium sp.]
MSIPPITRTITVDQLCIGLYVHLDMGWLEHSFARNSFKIKSNEQIAAIKQLGIKNIRVEPARCDGRPLPANPNPASEPVEVEQPSAEEQGMISAKKARIEKLLKEREAIAKCEKEYQKAANTLKNISRNLFSRPKEAYNDADQLIQQMLDSLMADKNIAIHLMNDKIAGEDAYYHSLNVSVLAMMLAKEMALPPEDIKALGIGCLFHDIGKIEIPDRIVNKTFALTRAEQNLLQMHCQYGATIAAKIELPKAAINIITQHHEYADGSGYPKQLRLEQISPLARIVTIINTYDNHCNRPNPADSLTPYEALSYMFGQQRKLFDPAPLNIFIRCMGVYPPGTLVKLSDDTLGMVVSVTSGKPLRPSVLIYDPSVPKNEAIILDLSVEPELEISASLKLNQLAPEVYDYLSPRTRMNYFFDSTKASPEKI